MAGWLPELQQLLNRYDSKQHEQKQVKMRFCDLQVTANVSVSPPIPGRVSPVIFVSWLWHSLEFLENDTVSRWMKVCLSTKNQREVDGKEISEAFAETACALPPDWSTWIGPTMCPEATSSSSVSLNPRRRWGFQVAGQLSGSADRVLIRSHSASALELSGDVQKVREAHVLVRSRSFLRFSYL